MSNRIRGEEVTLTWVVEQPDGSQAPMRGTWQKALNFVATPRADIPETEFIGEDESDLDYQFHGWDLSWEFQEQDASAVRFMADLEQRQQDRRAHPRITLQVRYDYRESGERSIVTVFRPVFISPRDQSFQTRKDYVATKFEAKAKRRTVITM